MDGDAEIHFGVFYQYGFSGTLRYYGRVNSVVRYQRCFKLYIFPTRNNWCLYEMHLYNSLVNLLLSLTHSFIHLLTRLTLTKV